MANPHTLTFTDANFETDALRSDVPVLVDVWSEGCGGCRQLAPLIDVVANEYAGKAKVGKLDAMSNLDTAMRYQIRILPTLLLFKDGVVVSQRAGVMDIGELRKLFDSQL
jgi:thioredoxin 1